MNCYVNISMSLLITTMNQDVLYVSAGQDEPDAEDKMLKRLLVRAPELLRSPHSPPRGSQKGDVYSFAFILYEVVGRRGPWGDIGLSYRG